MIAEVDPLAPHESTTRSAPSWARALFGLLSGASALSIASLLAALLSTWSAVDAVGSSFIDRTPAWLKDLAITWFGNDNKTALRIGIFAVLAVLALTLGIASRTSPTPILLGIVFLTVLGVVAISERPGSISRAIGALILGSAAGSIVSVLLWRAMTSHARRRGTPSESQAPLGWDRRSFLIAATAVAAGSAGAAAVSIRKGHLDASRIEVQRPATLPQVGIDGRAVSPPSDIHPDIRFITPNDEFFRIDTALSFPRVDLEKWELRIHGLVEEEIRLSYQDLLDLPQTERIITLCCVSNEVGGPYIGNAVWQGVLLADVLRTTRISPEAEQVFSSSLDGWTCGFPVENALDGRDALIAIGMNGEPLPLRHGFPARLVVPGLYGYVSATKWLSEIELNRWSDGIGYWLPRGWARLAPVKTQSRIDVPRRNANIDPGPLRIAGVAWAQHVGIAHVEVRVDREPWEQATLSNDVSDDTWRMWTYDWDAIPGIHTIQVRATDKNGITQTETVTPVAPDGATGWHTRRITVSDA
ncbi:MAG: molybdopterin-dependent oxidoreductase [Actinomycetota bacterium]